MAESSSTSKTTVKAPATVEVEVEEKKEQKEEVSEAQEPEKADTVFGNARPAEVPPTEEQTAYIEGSK